MEFTVNVNLTADSKLLEAVNRIADALSGAKLNEFWKEGIQEHISEANAEVIEEAVKPTTRKRRTQAEIAAEKEQPVIVPETVEPETVEPETVEPETLTLVMQGQAENDFVPSVEKLREIAIPLNKDGKDVAGLIREYGYKNLTEIASCGDNDIIRSFYSALLDLKVQK